MANVIKTTGMAGGPIITAAKSGDSVSIWVGRHNNSVEHATPAGDVLTTTWPCANGTETVTSKRQPGESNEDFTLRHEATYMLEMVGCPPVP